MRKLVFILIAFIAVITFIRAYDYSTGILSDGNFTDGNYTERTSSEVINFEETNTGETVSFALE